MTTDLDQRDLTRAEVEALPENDLRELLIAGFKADAASQMDPWGRTPDGPFILQACWRDSESFVRPLRVVIGESLSAAGLANIVADALIDHPDVWPRFLPPGKTVSHLGLLIVHWGWTMPDGHAPDDPREPADVPGAVETWFATGICHDGTGFMVFRKRGKDPLARVKPAAYEQSDAGQRDTLHCNLVRLNKLMHQVFADAPPMPSHLDGEQPGRTPEDDTYDYIAQALGRGMTAAELEASPPSALRSLALYAIRAEADAHRQLGWDKSSPPTLFKHHQHYGPAHDDDGAAVSDEGSHDCAIAMILGNPEVPVEQQLSGLMDLIHQEEDVREELFSQDTEYTGISLADEVWFAPSFGDDDDSRDPEDIPGALEVRMVLGVARDGDMFVVRRIRGHEPVVAIIDNPDEATISHSELAYRLRNLNALLADLDTPPEEAPQPNAVLDDLPPESPVAPPVPGLVLVTSRWKQGEPHEGRIYPPLPPDHPFAERICGCGRPLADDAPIQEFAMVPNTDPDREALRAGEWCDCAFLLVHQRCIRTVVALFAKATSDTVPGLSTTPG